MNHSLKLKKLDQVWAVVEKQYELIRVCGEGTYGQVCKAKNKVTGKIVAIKLIKDFLSNPNVLRRMIGEIQVLR